VTEFNDGTPESAEVTDLREAPAPEETPKPRFTRRIIGVAIAAGMLALGLGGGAFALLSDGDKADATTSAGAEKPAGGDTTITVTGTITVKEICSQIDDGGYSDMRQGADVVIKNESGTTIAIGALGSGHDNIPPGWCDFDFTVTDVPTDATFYEVEVGHRGALRYTLAELKQPLGLELGD
jgi:hypothetical protein